MVWENVVNVPHSAFCSRECKQWNVISCAYPLLLQYNPVLHFLLCLLPIDCVSVVESREHLLQTFVLMKAYLSREWMGS